jgi:hypothetical protein
MEFGLFHEFQDTSEAEAFSQSFALVDAAEQWGLDAFGGFCVWLDARNISLLPPSRAAVQAPGFALSARPEIGSS